MWFLCFGSSASLKPSGNSLTSNVRTSIDHPALEAGSPLQTPVKSYSFD